MARIWASLTCSFFVILPLCGDEPRTPDGAPLWAPGGFTFVRQGNQTTTSLGGGLFRRWVKVSAETSEGRIVTRFTLPSAFHSPTTLPMPGQAPAFIWIEIADPDGLIYLDGTLHAGSGRIRCLESPPLIPGAAYPLHVRYAGKQGDNLVVEDRQVSLRAGENVQVKFDGSRMVSFPVRWSEAAARGQNPAPTAIRGER